MRRYFLYAVCILIITMSACMSAKPAVTPLHQAKASTFQFLIYRGDQGKRAVILCTYTQHASPRIREQVLLRDGNPKLKNEKIQSAGYTRDNTYILIGSRDPKSDDSEQRLWAFNANGAAISLNDAKIEEGDFHGGYMACTFVSPDRKSVVFNPCGVEDITPDDWVYRHDLLTGARERLVNGELITVRHLLVKQNLPGFIYHTTDPFEEPHYHIIRYAGNQDAEIFANKVISSKQPIFWFRFSPDAQQLLVSFGRKSRGRLELFVQREHGFVYEAGPLNGTWGFWDGNNFTAIPYQTDRDVSFPHEHDGEMGIGHIVAGHYPKDYFEGKLLSVFIDKQARCKQHGNYHPVHRGAIDDLEGGSSSTIPLPCVHLMKWLDGGKSLLAATTNDGCVFDQVICEVDSDSYKIKRRLWRFEKSFQDFTVSPDKQWFAFAVWGCPAVFLDNFKQPGQLMQIASGTDKYNTTIQWLDR